MKRIRILLLVALLSLTVAAGLAFAQAEPGDAGVFFDPGGTQTRGNPLPLVPFEMYVVVFDLPTDIFAHQGSISYDPQMVVLSAVFAGPGPINIGTPTNWIVGTGGRIPGAGAVVLVQFQVLMFAPLVDAAVCLGPSTPSDFDPPVPGYADWDDIHPFGVAQNGLGVYPDGCAVVNPTHPEAPIATKQTSWGAVKAQF